RAAGPGIEDGWLLFLDGRQVDIGVLGTASLEQLPVDLVAIDSIVFTSAAAVVAGSFAGRGHVHVHTRRPQNDGFSARGRLGFGSETGDPGPFVFLPGGRTNRDRYGHESAAEASVRKGAWYATAAYLASVHLPTDPLVLPRMQAAAALTPRIERIAPSIRLGRDGAAGGHHLVAGVSRIDDWARIELAGLELPSRVTHAHASAAGAFALPRFELAYRAGSSRARLDSRPEATAPRLDLTWRTTRASVEARTPGGSRRAGITFVHRDVTEDGASPLGDGSDLGGYVTIDLQPAATISQQVAAMLTGHRNGMEGGVVVRNAVETRAGVVSLSISGSRGRALSERGFVDLLLRDGRWLEDAGLEATLPSGDAIVREGGIEAGWRRDAGRAGFTATLFLRAVDGALTAEHDLGWDPLFRAWRGPFTVRAASGRMIGASASARLAVSRVLELSADWHVAGARGDTAFRDAAAAFPVHRALAGASWRPDVSFGLGGAIEFESGRRWPGYDRPDDAAGKLHPGVGARATASLTAWKTFLGGRLRGQAVARNLAGDRVILHPEGSGSGLAFLFLLGGTL
ncbi:MAG TPA: hypothetical protein VF037_00425, partial [Gemmatimonadales bacterium]